MEYTPHTDDSLEHLFKYKSLDKDSIEYTERVFTHNELYFPKPSELNDPFECKPGVTVEGSTKEEMKKYFDGLLQGGQPQMNRTQRRTAISDYLKELSGNSIHKEVALLFKNVINKIVESAGVCSFSEKWDDLLMWSHYADSHRGICIRFKASSSTTFFGKAQKVSYQEEHPIIHMINDKDKDKACKSILVKADSWSYEHEWRIVEHEEGPGPHRFPTGLLDAVILGVNIREEHRKKIISWIHKSPHSPSIYQAKLKEVKYGLDMIEINNPNL
jgi:hypothetical protein